MPEDPVQELRELVTGLSEWLRYQRRLGRIGTKIESRPQPEPGRDLTAYTPTLSEVRAELGDCRRCKLAQGRKHLVFGEGSPSARLLFVGEGPGEDEDLQGRPFVGAAGKLLDKMLNKLGVPRESVYIANVVKCHPPGNRDPVADEIAVCLPFLKQQIAAVMPAVIVTLGRVATQALLATNAPMTRIRGQWQRFGNIRVMPTFHPSYLLRLPQERRKTWEDMQQVMEFLANHEI